MSPPRSVQHLQPCSLLTAIAWVGRCWGIYPTKLSACAPLLRYIRVKEFSVLNGCSVEGWHLQPGQVSQNLLVVRVHAQRILVALDGLTVLRMRPVQQSAPDRAPKRPVTTVCDSSPPSESMAADVRDESHQAHTTNPAAPETVYCLML